MRKVLESCPTCGGEIEIREIHCLECNTEVRSHYDLSPFSRLTAEQTAFLEMFVQARGNMRVLEQKLGVSYPTVRNRVEAIAARLMSGRAATPAATPVSDQAPTPPAVVAAPEPEETTVPAPRARRGRAARATT